MIQVVKKLMEFGMPFEYQHRGADGQIVESSELGIKVEETIEGKLLYEDEDCDGAYPISENSYKLIAFMIEDICVKETSSF